MKTLNLLEVILTPNQLTTIIVVSAVLLTLIVANVVLFILFRRYKARKLCSRQLDQKREELLEKLNAMRAGMVIVDGEEVPEPVEQLVEDVVAEETAEELTAEEIDEDNDSDDNDDDDSEGENDSALAVLPVDGEEGGEFRAEILAVRNMSGETRERLGFVGEEYDRKQYYVRYTYGFEAKLRAAAPEIQERYRAFVDELGLYKGVKVKESFRQQRITKGRKTLALILFKGKTLCVAFALDPKVYEETKYRGIDKSDKKRFEKTPMLFKLSSERRLEYSKYLLVQIADDNTIVMNDKPVEREYDFAPKTKDELFVTRKLQITVLGEAPDIDEEEWLAIQEAEAAAAAAAAEEVEEAEEIAEETVPEEELAVLDDSGEETEEVDTVVTEQVVTTVDGKEEIIIRRTRYNRSFLARLTQSSDEVKARYSELKNYLLSYKKVKSSLSWRRESFRLGRGVFACLVIRGKTLCLCLAIDPKHFDDTKYKVVDLSIRSPKCKQPCMYRITGDRRVKFAKQMIDILMQELGAELLTDYVQTDYTMPYRTTEALIEDNLIRVTFSENAMSPEEAEAEVQVEPVAEQPEEAPEEVVEEVVEEVSEEVVEEQPEEAPEEVVEEAVEEVPEEVIEEQPEEAPEEVVEEVSEEVVEEQPEETPEEVVEEQLPERDFEILEEVAVSEVDVMTDEEVKELVETKVVKRKKAAKVKKGIVNINALSDNFETGAHVTIEALHEKHMIAKDINYIKVLADGSIDKPLIVEADDFSLQAAKMVVLTGGRVIRINEK